MPRLTQAEQSVVVEQVYKDLHCLFLRQMILTPEIREKVKFKLTGNSEHFNLNIYIEEYERNLKVVKESLEKLRNSSQKIINCKHLTKPNKVDKERGIIPSSFSIRNYTTFRAENTLGEEEVKYIKERLEEKTACELGLLKVYDWNKLKTDISTSVAITAIPRNESLSELIDRLRWEYKERLEKGEYDYWK